MSFHSPFYTEKQKVVIDTHLDFVAQLLASHMGVLDVSIGELTRQNQQFFKRSAEITMCRECARKIYLRCIQDGFNNSTVSIRDEVGLYKSAFVEDGFGELYTCLHSLLIKCASSQSKEDK